MKYPKVSIITVNYKQRGVTCELLNSIAELTYPNLETIIVDNAQESDDSEVFKIHLPEARVINVPENIGFAGGNNVGIDAANGDYVFLLNNDTEVKEGTIEKILESFSKNERIGAISPILRYYDTPEQIQFAGFTEINPLTGRNDLIQEQPENLIADTSYFHGAAVMIPMHVIEQCGLMPEEYFLYYEELDWSRIIRRKGYEIKVRTDIEVLHKESVTTGKNSPLKVYYQNRNRIHFMRKSNRKHWLFFLAFFVLISTPKNLLSHLIKRDLEHFRAFSKAVMHGLIIPRVGIQAF